MHYRLKQKLTRFDGVIIAHKSQNVSLPSIGCRNKKFLIAKLRMVYYQIRVIDTVQSTNYAEMNGSSSSTTRIIVGSDKERNSL